MRFSLYAAFLAMLAIPLLLSATPSDAHHGWNAYDLSLIHI